MEKVKIKDIKTGAIKEVKKSLAGDFIGTGKFKLYEEPRKETPKPSNRTNFNVNQDNNNNKEEE